MRLRDNFWSWMCRRPRVKLFFPERCGCELEEVEQSLGGSLGTETGVKGYVKGKYRCKKGR
ncbi:MAG: hypothetical protein L6408_05935 [Nanoarchaeota archaeon]|nr:hypothetical protein [Nanoarchaeota archaeon]